MKHDNQFDYLGSSNTRINILLEHFCFFHRPITSDIDEETDSKYIGKPNPVHQLSNWIKHNEANSGSYLVTGYRGAGKSSFVGKLLKELQKEEKHTRIKYIPLFINFGQENIKEIEILRIIVKRLLNELLERDKFVRLYYSMKHCIPLLIGILIAVLAFFYHDSKEIVEYVCLVLAGLCLGVMAQQIYVRFNRKIRAITKLRNLTHRLNASIQIETGGLAEISSYV